MSKADFLYALKASGKFPGAAACRRQTEGTCADDVDLLGQGVVSCSHKDLTLPPPKLTGLQYNSVSILYL